MGKYVAPLPVNRYQVSAVLPDAVLRFQDALASVEVEVDGLTDGQVAQAVQAIAYDVTFQPAALANGSTIRTQAAAALTSNRAYIALAAPTNAQVVAQTKALSRQMNALIRLALGQLDGTD